MCGNQEIKAFQVCPSAAGDVVACAGGGLRKEATGIKRG